MSEITMEQRVKSCITATVASEAPGAEIVGVVRVELHGIARFACWWFVIWSIIGLVAAIAMNVH